MRKTILIFISLLTLFIVSCDNDRPPIPGGGKGNPNVLVSDLNVNGNILSATLDIQIEITNDDDLLLILNDAANLIYYNYKEEIGTKSFTFYFVVQKETDEIGTIAYKANESIDNPGLSYLSSNLSLN